jgi:triosephosphate isomerase
VLAQQLKSIINAIQHNNNHIIIAYEPIWSIGTGIIPEQQHLQEIFIWLTEWFAIHLPDNSIQLLYGGSVNPTNISQLKNIPHINGFLIGKASTEFENFAKIIT